MSGIAQGRSLELYFIDGRPDGMLTAEVFNWTGHVLVTPRTRLKEALARTEAKYTGVYILLGEQAGKPLAYIGEAEELSSRIKSHETGKDWWTVAALITSAANNLHKAHVKYLESRLVEEAKAVGTTPLANGNTPPRPGLSESAQANMEAFLEYLFMVLPAVRIDMFIQNKRSSAEIARSGFEAPAPTFEINYPKYGLKASAILEDGEFVVLAGSQARLTWEGVLKSSSGYNLLHEELLRAGVLEASGDFCVFRHNYAFNSPSAAAAVVYGRQANGPISWKTATGKTYKDWEAEQLAD